MRNHFQFSMLFFLLLTVAAPAWSQDTIQPLQIDEFIRQATSNNANIQLAKRDEQIAASVYKQTQAMYLPQVGFSYSALASNDPLNAFGFKLQQKSIAQSDFDPSLLNHPSGIADFTTQLSIRQPLLNLDMQYQRKAAGKQQEMYKYATQRTREMIVYQAQQAYLQLQMSYDAQKVLEESLEAVKAVYKFTNDRYQQGLMQKSDLLNIEVQIKTIEAGIGETKTAIRNISDMMNLLMNKRPGIVYSPEKAVISTDKNFPPDSIPAARSDFRAMETAVDVYGLAIKSNKMSYWPKLNMFANYQLHDNSPVGFGAGGYLAGIQLTWDIFKGNSTKNKIATQVLERNKLKEELDNRKAENAIELQKAYRQFTDADLRLQQQQAAIDAAVEALRILQNRYMQGLVNTSDVLLAQTQVSQQKLGFTQSEFNKNMALAYWQFLTASAK